MKIAWTTVGTHADAVALAEGAVAARLAACVQFEPTCAVYRWKGKIERAEEWRLTFKALAANAPALEEWVRARHPYETPEWVVVDAAHIGEKYRIWAQTS